jgi:hypothetical protein
MIPLKSHFRVAFFYFPPELPKFVTVKLNRITMEKTGIFRTMILSFYSADIYREAAKRWRDRFFLYLLALVFVLMLIFTCAAVYLYESKVRAEIDYIVMQAPHLVISNGIASMDKPSPYTIKSRDGEAIAIFDMRGDSAIRFDPGRPVVLVTRDRLYTVQKENEYRMYAYTGMDHFELDADIVQNWLKFAWVILAILFVIGVIVLYIYRLLQAVINAAIGMVIAGLLRVRLDFAQLMAIASVAITPVALAGALVLITGIHLPAKGWIGFFLAIGFLAFGIMANRDVPAESQVIEAKTDIPGNEGAN